MSVSLLKFSFCQEPGTCTDMQCLFPKPQTLFSKVGHHDQKNPEMVSPLSPPPILKPGPGVPGRAQFLHNSFSSPGARLGILRDTLSRGFQSAIIVLWKRHAKAPIALLSDILSSPGRVPGVRRRAVFLGSMLGRKPGMQGR